MENITDSDPQKLSLHLSEVLADIGVTDDVIRARRRTFLEEESVDTVGCKMLGLKRSFSYFGSQSEGTSTIGLHSDIDQLKCFPDTFVIENTSQWEPNRINLLLHKEPWMPFGYRSLIPLQRDKPVPLSEIVDEDKDKYTRGKDGVIYSLHTFLHRSDPTGVMHGPAWASKGSGGWPDEDWVNAYHTQYWPEECTDWEARVRDKPWPSEKTRKQIIESGCFVIPVSHKEIGNLTLFRLSTTYAERLLIQELNLTQLRCLILLKLLIKSNPDESIKDSVKSFYLKTAVFHVSENLDPEYWREDNILNCLTQCLKWLVQCLDDNCIPHYLQPSLDMFEGRFDLTKRRLIRDALADILKDPVGALLNVDIDLLGSRLRKRFGESIKGIPTTCTENKIKVGRFLSNLYIDNFPFDYNLFLKQDDSTDFDGNLAAIENRLEICETIKTSDLSPYRKIAANRYATLFSSTLGMLVSIREMEITEKALAMFKKGFKSDAAAGRLKYATALYATGRVLETLAFLAETENCYDKSSTMPVCLCYRRTKVYTPKYKFAINVINRINNGTLNEFCAFCVVFKKQEELFVPQELCDEMQRLTNEELSNLDEKETWMKWASVDALPYLYFLIFKVSKDVYNVDEQNRAISMLKECIDTENLNHKETALNLLGQCLEKVNRADEAMGCYRQSLEVRPTCNVARTLVRRLESRQSQPTDDNLQ